MSFRSKALIGACLLPLMVVGCLPQATTSARPFPGQAEPEPPRGERTLVIGVRSEPQSIAARPSIGGARVAAAIRAFNALLEIVDGQGTAQPYLAEALPVLHSDSWRVLSDGRMETRYRLKPDLTWHDAVPLSAQDFVFAWNVWAQPELGMSARLPISEIEAVEAPDQSSLVIHWRRLYPGAGVLQSGGQLGGFASLPRHILERAFHAGQWEAFDAHPFWTREFVGLGPYALQRWEPGSFIEGTAFAAHALGRPKIDRVRIVFTSDANAGLAAILAGETHLVTDGLIDVKQAVELKRDWAPRTGGAVSMMLDALRVLSFQLRPELATPREIHDARIRRALAHVIDRTALNETLFGGEAIIAESIVGPLVPYFSEVDRAISKYPHDVRASERLMNQAGLAKGPDGVFLTPSGSRLSFELKALAAAPWDAERSILASGWREAGVDVQETGLPVAQAQTEARTLFPSLLTYSISTGESASVAVFTSSNIPRPETRWAGANRGGWSNTEYDRLATEFDSILVPGDRVRQIVRLTRILSDELPGIPLYFTVTPVAHSGSLKGPGPVGLETSGLVTWNIHQWELR